MTARAFLEQARNMDRRIEALRERRQHYEDLAASCTAKYRQGPGGSTRRVSSVEEYDCKIADLDRELYERIERYAETCREIEREIDRLRDARHRDVLTLRYLNCWKWDRVARATNYSVDTVWRLHREALREMEKLRMREGRK